MERFVIVDDSDAVVFGPTGWSPYAFGQKLRELLEALDGEIGSVAVGVEAPTSAQTWEGCPFRVLPCLILGGYDPATQVLGVPVVNGDVATVAAVDKPLAEVQALRIGETKSEARRRILAIAPEWKQANLTARAAELTLLFPGVKGVEFEEPYRSEYMAGQAIWDQIKVLREASNVREAWIVAKGRTVADLRSMANAPGWAE